jgi:effector-binding domain-containing protein
MANIICTKCGATGFSKCPVCRTIFPDNQIDAMLSHILKFKEDKDNKTVTISYTAHIEDVEEAFKRLFNVLSRMETETAEVHGDYKYPSFKEYSCNHTWVFAEGEESDIGCGHR